MPFALCAMPYALLPMNESTKTYLRLGIGLLIGALFIYAAFRKVEIHQMWQALKAAHYGYVLLAAATLFLSHFLRAFRWRYLLDPIRHLDTASLFSALIIGYAANSVVPAHLGEFLRAYTLSKKRGIPMSAVFGTIVVERIIDIFSLLALMVLAVFLYPFPPWVIKSGYIMFAGTLALFLVLALMKRATALTKRLLAFTMKPFPKVFERNVHRVTEEFLSGMVPLRRWHDYVTVGLLSVSIWACYGLIFHLCLHSFDFFETYHLAWSVSLILLAVTTIAVVVPSSPGYVGPDHVLCQITLAAFGVPGGPALSFALVVHGISILSVLILGLVLAHYEGMTILKMPEGDSEIKERTISAKLS